MVLCSSRAPDACPGSEEMFLFDAGQPRQATADAPLMQTTHRVAEKRGPIRPRSHSR